MGEAGATVTPAEYFALCTCPRAMLGPHCVGRRLDPHCPWHSLPAEERFLLTLTTGQSDDILAEMVAK